MVLGVGVRGESRGRRVKKELATMPAVRADSPTLLPSLNPPLKPAHLLALETLLSAPLFCTPAGRGMRTYPQATLEGFTPSIPCADQLTLPGGHRLYLNSSW
jgi:hypothetical protein